MKKVYRFILMALLTGVLFPLGAKAQTWYQVTTFTVTGPVTQTLGSTTVTITGNGGNYNVPYTFCSNMPGPYLIGHFSASYYLFSFSTPVNLIRIRVHGMQSGEVISVEINGSSYSLGTANNLVQCTSCSAGCQDPLASFVGGNMDASATLSVSGGEFTIGSVPGGISSIKLSHNGLQAGAGISVEFQEGVPAQASNNGPVCWGDTLKLFGSPTIAGGNYSWTGPNGFTSTQQNPIILNPTAANDGDYVLTINGSSSDTTHVTMKPRPSNPVVTHTQPACAGSLLNLSAVSSPSGATYTWTGPDGFNDTGADVNIPNVQPVNSGQYTVQAEINGCNSKKVNVNIQIQQPSKTFLADTICAGTTYEFGGRKLNKSGKYVDSLTNFAGCDSLVNLALTVRPPLPLTIHYDQSKSFCLGDSTTLIAQGASQYSWKTGTTKLGDTSAIHARLLAASNTFTVTGTDSNNCKGSKSVTIKTHPCCQVLIPNAFSPNGDGLNDDFELNVMGHFSEYHLDIFNRYGQVVFTSVNPNDKWDGTINKKPADVGTYFYVLKSKCLTGTVVNREGNITLIR